MKKRIIKLMGLVMITGLVCAACTKKEEGNVPSQSETQIQQETETEIETVEPTQSQIIVPTEPTVELPVATDAQMALDNLNKTIETYMPGVVCWGDSLTLGAGSDIGYPDVLREYINSNILYDTGCEIPVIMMGVGGEDSATISARACGISMVIMDDFTIPAECTPVQIRFRTEEGRIVEPILQGDAGMEYVVINGIEGTLEYLPDVTGESGARLLYYFKRSTAGTETVNVSAGTKIETRGYLEYKDYLPIIFMGENGGFDSSDELIRQQMAIVENGTNKLRYIIIGITSGTQESRKDLEAAMQEQYGNQYINARKMLSTDGMNEMQIETTVFDKMMMDEGKVPGRLLSGDSVHLNEAGYRYLGKIVYDRMYELGYFKEIEEAANTYRSYK